jgi:hypothetical protein
VLSNLLSTVAPHHFAKPFAEADGDDFWLFGSTIEPKGSIVEPTVNALNHNIFRYPPLNPLYISIKHIFPSPFQKDFSGSMIPRSPFIFLS